MVLSYEIHETRKRFVSEIPYEMTTHVRSPLYIYLRMPSDTMVIGASNNNPGPAEPRYALPLQTLLIQISEEAN